MTPRGLVATERPAISDQQVMASVRDGSIAAFEVLYDRYCERAYRIARSVCRDDGRSQEAVQEAFVAVWKSRANYEDHGNVAAWIFTLVRHRSIDVARRNDHTHPVMPTSTCCKAFPL